MNNTNNMHKEMRLAQIENDLKKAESQKKTAIVMMVVSIFFLWPLIILGIIQYNNANKEIEKLNQEKQQIILQDYLNGHNQQ